jgi:Phosphomannomutase
MHRLETLILDPRMIREAKSLRIVYTPLHGTGSVIIRPMLNRLGFNFKSCRSRIVSTAGFQR